jgi:phage tail sheath protein FI
MPTYLTPGVYVEEVPSANKPIEGVSTSVAAFVGLTPGGPVNTPMRISNWTQFSKIFGDPNNPDNGPFMEGTYMAHSVYGFFQNGGSNCWIVRVGEESGAGARPQAALPAATDKSVEAFRAQALPKVDGTVEVELTEEPKAGDGDATYRLVVRAGSESEEYDGLTLKKGRANLATKVNAGSKLIKIEETGASLPDAQRVPATGKYTLSAPAQEPSEINPGHFSGDEARRKGMGALSAIDEVTMVLMPDLWTIDNDTQVRDLQGKMIAHCENMGDRMAILDAPPDLLPQEILEWRMNTAGYDSKMSALYYPWIEVMDPLTNRPVNIPPSGHIAGLWCRVDGHAGGAGRPQQGRHQLHPRVPRPRHPRVGRPHAVERPGVALHQRAPALQLHQRVDHERHAVERVRAERRVPVAAAAQRGVELPHEDLAVRGPVRQLADAGLLREVRRRDQPARRDRGRPGRLRGGHRPGEARGVRDLPPEPVQRRRRRGSRRVAKTNHGLRRTPTNG